MINGLAGRPIIVDRLLSSNIVEKMIRYTYMKKHGLPGSYLFEDKEKLNGLLVDGIKFTEKKPYWPKNRPRLISEIEVSKGLRAGHTRIIDCSLTSMDALQNGNFIDVRENIISYKPDKINFPTEPSEDKLERLGDVIMKMSGGDVEASREMMIGQQGGITKALEEETKEEVKEAVEEKPKILKRKKK